MGRQPRLFAGLNVLDLEVAAIGDDIDILDIENGAGRLGGLFQQAHVHDLIGHSLLDDHFVLRVDRDLDVVADANLRMGGHRPAVGISQRYLVLAGSFRDPPASPRTGRVFGGAPRSSRPGFAPPPVPPSSISPSSSRRK